MAEVISKVIKKSDYQDVMRIPPHDEGAESAVLGALMIDKNAILKVADTLSANDFYKGSHKKIYGAILSLYEKRNPIDILSVSAFLKERHLLDEAGGSAYLAELVNQVPSAAHVGHYAQIVREKRILRELISTSVDIAEKAFSARDDRNMENLLDDVEQRMFAITQGAVTQDFANIKDELDNAFERIQKVHKDGNVVSGVETGFKEIDKRLSGLQPADLIILGARPSLGKTSLALDIARHVGIKKKQPVGIFSLEMSRAQITDRLLSAEALVNLQKMRTGGLNLNDDEVTAGIHNAYEKLSSAPIFIDDTPSPNILQMRAMARRLQMRHGLSLLIVDYLQLVSPRNPRDNIVQQITEISRGLKALARELKVPVLALSQLSRAGEQREDKSPKLHDLRESGSLEQDSDIVIFIWRKADDKDASVLREIKIAKYRNGATDDFQLRFDREYASFRDPYYGGEPPPGF